MRFRTLIKIFATASVLALALPSLFVATFRQEMSPITISYNPIPAQQYHSPLSSMALVAITNSTPIFQSPNIALPASASRNSAFESIRQNAIRFTTDPSYYSQSETTVSVDPQNQSRVLGGFNDQKFIFCRVIPTDCPGSIPASATGFTTSTDGGKSIAKSDDLPNVHVGELKFFSFGDPSVGASADGNFFFSSLAVGNSGLGVMIAESNPNLFNPSVSCNTLFFASTSNPCWKAVFIYGSSFLFGLEDKPLLAVDRDKTSPFYGSVYVAWDHFFPYGTSGSFIARCASDLSSCTMVSGGGQPIVSGDDAFPTFTTPIVDKNGNIHVTWCNYGTTFTFGPVTCKIRSSTPGGNSFGPTTTILSFMGFGTTLPRDTVTLGWATEQFRTFSIPSLAADMSSKTNNLYFTIQVCAAGHYYVIPVLNIDTPGNCGASDVIFSKSTDGGLSWSSPVTLSNPAVNDQPFVTVDSVTGHVFVFYYTTQFDPFDHRIDVVALMSSNGGGRFNQIRITTVSDEPNADPNLYDYLSPFGGSFSIPEFGDYFQAVASGGTLWVLFTGNYAVEDGTFQTDPFLAVLNGQ